MSDVAALEVRVTRLEDDHVELRHAIVNGFAEIKATVRQEISDLKKEQIAEIREDYKNLWQEISTLKAETFERRGGYKVISFISHLFTLIIGGLIAAGATWMSSWKH